MSAKLSAPLSDEELDGFLLSEAVSDEGMSLDKKFKKCCGPASMLH